MFDLYGNMWPKKADFTNLFSNSNCQCSLFSMKSPIIRIFCISGLLSVPVDPDTVLFFPTTNTHFSLEESNTVRSKLQALKIMQIIDRQSLITYNYSD
jgi:hypothetical protein